MSDGASRSALKKHLRAKLQAQPPQGTRSAFRDAEKIYLSRHPPPDYSHVIDFSLPSVPDGVTRHVCSSFTTPTAVYTVKAHPGLLVIPGLLGPIKQRSLIKQCLRDFAHAPNLNNLNTHYKLPAQGLWYHFENQIKSPSEYRDFDIQPLITGHGETSTETPANTRRLIKEPAITADVPREVLLSKKEPPPPGASLKPVPLSQLMYKLRWSNLGLMYHWTSKSYHYEEVFEKGLDAMIPVPAALADFATTLLRAIPRNLRPAEEEWDDFLPQSGILNFYQMKDTLMGHIDQSELVEDKPLVSLSFGHAAIFLIGGTTRDTAPTAMYLRSGDALIMSGACRRVFHGVPRIVEGTLPNYLDHAEAWSDDQKLDEGEGVDWEPFAQYLQTTRINVNIRQVLPKDFCTKMS